MPKILYLEDEKEIGRFYKKHFVQHNFEVSLTFKPEETLQVAQTFQADYVILDHGIKASPQTGTDIIPQLKKILPKAKIIMLSNSGKEQLEEKTRMQGADIFLEKMTHSPGKLLEIIYQHQNNSDLLCCGKGTEIVF